MNQKILLWIAAGLILFTCIGHTIGTFKPIPSEEIDMVNTSKIMKTTLVPLPMGIKQNYYDLLFGANISLSIFLLFTGISFIVFSSADNSNNANRKLLLLHSIGLLCIAIISTIYFFPLPAICTGIAGVLGVFVFFRKE